MAPYSDLEIFVSGTPSERVITAIAVVVVTCVTHCSNLCAFVVQLNRLPVTWLQYPGYHL